MVDARDLKSLVEVAYEFESRIRHHYKSQRGNPMNSKGHLYVSTMKSIIRIGACILSMATSNVVVLAIGFLGAEVLGIIEELVDQR